MDELIEKLIALAGNKNRYQYFTLCAIIFLWINCNFISCVLTFLERGPIVSYYDTEGNFHDNEILTSDLCSELNGRNYTVKESFKYSWITEYHLECKNFEVGNIGSFVFIGNTAGGIVFSITSKFISHKKIIIISSFGFCLAAFLATLVKSFDYFYALLVCEIFIGLFGNCLCYSSLVISEETVEDKKRSLFNSIINVGYGLCGAGYALLFYACQEWRLVFYILIGATLFTLVIIWIFVYDSPRGYMNNEHFDKALYILEGIASFNGKKEEFRKSIQTEEYQDIIRQIKGEIPIKSEEERSSSININEIKEETEEKKEREYTTSLISQSGEKVKERKISVWALFKYPSLRRTFLILNILWVGTRASFNGVTISSKSFAGNFYINMIVLYFIEIAAYFVSGVLIDIKILGRRRTLWIQYIVLGILFILLAFLDLDTIGSLALNYISRFCAAGIEVIYYTYSIELYPNQVRSIAFGINTTFGNTGSIIAAHLIEILLSWQYLMIFAVITAINGVLLFCLDETVGRPMVESIKELDQENDIKAHINTDFKDENDRKILTQSEYRDSNRRMTLEQKAKVKEEKKDDN